MASTVWARSSKRNSSDLSAGHEEQIADPDRVDIVGDGSGAGGSVAGISPLPSFWRHSRTNGLARRWMRNEQPEGTLQIVRKISIARRPLHRPLPGVRIGCPHKTARAPKQIALTISVPRRMPPSIPGQTDALSISIRSWRRHVVGDAMDRCELWQGRVRQGLTR